MEIQSMRPSDIIKPGRLGQYEVARETVWQDLVRLNTSLFIVSKLLDFPRHLFYEPNRETFFSVCIANFFDISVVIEYKLGVDKRRDVLSMEKFRNLVQAALKQDWIEEFKRESARISSDTVVEDIKEKVKTLRNSRIAHLNKEFALSEKSKERLQVVVSHLRKMCDYLNGQFEFLCFGYGHGLLPIEYDPAVAHSEGSDVRSDIEWILDLVVGNSSLFNMPEKQPELWGGYRTKMPESHLESFNKYRRRLGKPEV